MRVFMCVHVCVYAYVCARSCFFSPDSGYVIAVIATVCIAAALVCVAVVKLVASILRRQSKHESDLHEPSLSLALTPDKVGPKNGIWQDDTTDDSATKVCMV